MIIFELLYAFLSTDLKTFYGSLFTVLPATIMVNSEENEMSSEFLFSSCKMMGRKQGAPQDPEGVERGVPLLETPHFTTRK